MTIDELQVLITAKTTALQKEIGKANQTISSLQKSANKTQSGVTSAFKKLKTGIIALGIGKIIKDSISMGMDAVESDSLFETSLGNMADSVRSWSDEIANTLGLSAVSIRKNTGVIFNMTTSMGLAKDNALKMSKGISLLSEDMASFYNLNPTEAFNKLRAGLTGETEPLKALGILVDENTVKQVAYSTGIAKTGSELTQQQKVLARYMAILKQTGNAQGDLARTIDSPANQLRILKNQIKELGLAFSNFLLPVFKAVLPYITAFTKVITTALNSLSKVLGLKKSETNEEVKDLGTGLGIADKNAKKLSNTLASFDEMNVLQDTSTDTSSEGGTSVGLDFDISEYDAHLDWVNSETDKIAKQIEKSFKKVGNVLSSIWNSQPITAYRNLISTEFETIKNLSIQLGTDLWNNMSTTWFNIETNVGTTFSNISTLFTTMWTDMQLGLETWGQPIIDGISNLFNSIWETAIDPAIQLITKGWSEFSGILVNLWNQYGQPLVNNIGEFATKVIGYFQKVYDNVLEPIITPFLETLSWLWDTHLKKMIENVGNFVMKLVNGALEIYNKFIQPVASWILEKLSPVFSFFGNLVSGVIGSVVAFISDAVGNITRWLGGIINFITGIFTGNWEKAWNGVKDIFGGIVDSLVAVFKLPINLIIDGINSFISGLNKVQVPDWVPLVGGKGINIPKIPKLARGGVVDSPTIAEIGEAGKEVVMPLERNTSWIQQLADKLTERIGNSENNNPIQLIVKIGEDTILDKFIDKINQKNFETNGEVFDL